MAHTNSQAWLKSLLQKAQERLQHWQDLVAEEYPWEPFSPRHMIEKNFAHGQAILTCTTMFARKGDLQAYTFGNEARIEYGKQGLVGYGSFTMPSANESVRGISKSLAFELVTADDPLYFNLEEARLLKPTGIILCVLAENFGHNIYHAATEFAHLFDRESCDMQTDKLTESFSEDTRNQRVVNGVAIPGYEEFLLQLNQQAFLRARVKKNSQWFKELVRATDYCAQILELANDQLASHVIPDLRAGMEFFISNFVHRHLLQNADPEEWSYILRTASPEVPEPSFYLGEKPATIADVSMAYFGATQQDYITAQRLQARQGRILS